MGRRKRSNKKNVKQAIYYLFMFVIFIIITLTNSGYESNVNNININTYSNIINISDVEEYTDSIYVTINNNKPYFTEEDYTIESFEIYSKLDEKGRCGVAYANICKDIIPDKEDERESISNVYPTGWKQKKYDGEYLYNRCHLIGYQLAGENANELNLITGTRYFNVSGMLPFENEVAEYIEENEDNHVLYRVTPVFEEDNLLASGVQIEAYSVEDNGEGICFNVYVYNVQPGINIDYKTGKSSLEQ